MRSTRPVYTMPSISEPRTALSPIRGVHGHRITIAHRIALEPRPRPAPRPTVSAPGSGRHGHQRRGRRGSQRRRPGDDESADVVVTPRVRGVDTVLPEIGDGSAGASHLVPHAPDASGDGDGDGESNGDSETGGGSVADGPRAPRAVDGATGAAAVDSPRKQRFRDMAGV